MAKKKKKVKWRMVPQYSKSIKSKYEIYKNQWLFYRLKIFVIRTDRKYFWILLHLGKLSNIKHINVKKWIKKEKN